MFSMKKWLLGVVLLTVSLACSFQISPPAPSVAPAGFLTLQQGRLLLDGKPYFAVGFNKWDLLQQLLAERFPTNFGEWGVGRRRTAAEQSLQDLKEMGFDIIRVFGSPFLASQLTATFFDPAGQTNFLQANDDMIALARQYDQRIVYTLGWKLGAFATRRGETIRQLVLDKNANSRKDFELFVRTIVTRYKDEPAIALWDIVNEANLYADVGDAPAAGVVGRIPTFTSRELGTFLSDITAIIKAIDPNHLVTTGNSRPRDNQFAMNADASDPATLVNGTWRFPSSAWLARDTYEQTAQMLELTNPTEVVSIHSYGLPPETRLLADYSRMAAAAGPGDTPKPLFIGEIGPQLSGTNTLVGYGQPFSRAQVEAQLAEIVTNRIPISLFWAYQVDTSNQSNQRWDLRRNGRSGADNEFLRLIKTAQDQLRCNCR